MGNNEGRMSISPEEKVKEQIPWRVRPLQKVNERQKTQQDYFKGHEGNITIECACKKIEVRFLETIDF
jgi:hypothetical protein